MHLLHLHSKTTNMRMSNGTPELCESWNLLGKLVGQGGFQAPVWMYAHLGPYARTQVLVVASMGLQNHNPPWPPIQALACLTFISDHTTSSCQLVSFAA